MLLLNQHRFWVLFAGEPTVSHSWVFDVFSVACTDPPLSQFRFRPVLISVCLHRGTNSVVSSFAVRTHNHVFCGDTKECAQFAQLPTPCHFELGAYKVWTWFVYLMDCLYFFIVFILVPLRIVFQLHACCSVRMQDIESGENIRYCQFVLSWFSSACHSKAAVATASNEEPGVREARSVSDQLGVHPVDCVLSEWSSWSRCETCQKKRVSMMRLRCSYNS